MIRRIFALSRRLLGRARRLSSTLLDRARRERRRRIRSARDFIAERIGPRRFEVRRPERQPAPARPDVPEHADERTIRRIAERQRGGMSSREANERWRRGEKPGGTHGGASHRDEGPSHPRPEHEEPQERVEHGPGGARRIAVHRRGS